MVRFWRRAPCPSVGGQRCWAQLNRISVGRLEALQYTLLFGRRVIATVEERDADFPAIWGSFELDPGLRDDPSLRRVVDYIEFSIRTWPLIDAGRTEETYEEESQFQDLIDSSDWWLADQDGQLLPILIPVFETNGRINWRLDPNR